MINSPNRNNRTIAFSKMSQNIALLKKVSYQV